MARTTARHANGRQGPTRVGPTLARVLGIVIATAGLAAVLLVVAFAQQDPTVNAADNDTPAPSSDVRAGTPGDLPLVSRATAAQLAQGKLGSRPTVAVRPTHTRGLYSPAAGKGVGTKQVSTLSIPAIGVHAPVVTSSLVRSVVAVPADVSKVGWYNNSAHLDDVIGSTVIAGHVSDDHDRPGALYDLAELHTGDLVAVTKGGITHRFKVTSLLTYPRTKQLPASIFSAEGPHRLTLVTCTDKVTYPDGHFHYLRNLVVTAKPV